MLKLLKQNFVLFIASLAGVFYSRGWVYAGVAAFVLAALLRNAEDD